MRKIKLFFVLCLLLIAGVNLQAASIEVFPADLRQDKTVRCIGDEINSVHFILYSDRACGGKPGRYLLKDFNKDISTASIKFSIDIPADLEYLGIVDMREVEFAEEDKMEKVTIDGKAYNRHTITLKRDVIISRVVKSRHRYDINLWFKMPEKYQGSIKWRLLKNGSALVSAESKLKTVGTIAEAAKLPKRFKFFLTYPDRSIPEELEDARINLYKKMGVTQTVHMYSSSVLLSRQESYLKKIKQAGIKIVLQRAGSFSSQTRPLTKSIKREKGLITSAQKAYDAIINDSKKAEIVALKDYMDGVLLDYEPAGAMAYPGYNDEITVAAFCKEKGVNPEDVKSKYNSEYIAFRDALIAKPILAVSALTKSVKPGTPFFMEQGAGVPIGSKIDYKIYDKYVDYHLPMIYTGTLDFYHRVALTADYIGKDKLMPTTTAGFTDSSNKILSRSAPGALLMDYIGSASQGIAGIKHWPGAEYLDGGQLYEFVEGARLLGVAEDFYYDGTDDAAVEMKGLPYIEKTIKLPGKTLDISQPQWQNYLVNSAKKYNNETLLTILNFHSSEDAFVRIKINNRTAASYLKNINTGKMLSINGKTAISSEKLKEGIMIKVPAQSPGLWLLTDKEPTGDIEIIAEDTLIKQYKNKKAEAGKVAPKITIGTVGQMSVSYTNVISEMGANICLSITSPNQAVAIKNAGGIIWKWTIDAIDLISKKDVNDGAGMDLLWLPDNARWGGDQINEMTLVKCENSGSMVTVVYEQRLQSSLPNIKLRKTYRIPADKTEIEVDVSLINGTEQPVELSYWSHNIFGNVDAGSRIFMIAKGNTVESVPYGSRKDGAYSNKKYAGKYDNFLMKKARKNYASNAFGEYYKNEKTGIVITVPEDFMQIYNWTGKGKASLEWMGIPRSIATGDAYNSKYVFRAYTGIDETQFKKEIMQAETIKLTADEMSAGTSDGGAMQTLPLPFIDSDNNNMPDGYFIYKEPLNGTINMDTNVFAGESGPSLRFDCGEMGLVGVTTGKKKRLSLKPDTKYILTFQLKIKDMKVFGKWPKGFIFYLLGVSKSYTWIGASGKGDTDGWITAVMPFDTGMMPAMAKPYIRILCNNISGTIWVQNISVIEVTDETLPKSRYFILDNGTQVNGGIFKF